MIAHHLKTEVDLFVLSMMINAINIAINARPADHVIDLTARIARPGAILGPIVAPSIVHTIAPIVLLVVIDVRLTTIDVPTVVIDDRIAEIFVQLVDPNLEDLGQILANLVHLVDTVAVKIDIFLGLPVDTILAL